MRKYRPSYIVSIPGIGLLIAATVIGGIAIGAAVVGVSRIVYIPLLMPIGMGVAGFFAIGFVIEKAKLPNPFLAALFGVLIGTLAYGTHHYGEYLIFRHEGVEAIREELRGMHGDVDEEAIVRVFNAALEEETGSRGFLGYLRWVAQSGVSFFSQHEIGMPPEVRGPGLTITSGWVWGYWLVEAVLATSFAAWAVIKVARQPFCEGCGEWYRAPAPIGSVSKAYAQRFLELLKVGDLVQAARFVTRTGKTVPKDLEVQAQICPNCPSNDIVLLVNRVVPQQQRGIFPRRAFEGSMTPDELAAFSEAVRSR